MAYRANVKTVIYASVTQLSDAIKTMKGNPVQVEAALRLQVRTLVDVYGFKRAELFSFTDPVTKDTKPIKELIAAIKTVIMNVLKKGTGSVQDMLESRKLNPSAALLRDLKTYRLGTTSKRAKDMVEERRTIIIAMLSEADSGADIIKKYKPIRIVSKKRKVSSSKSKKASRSKNASKSKHHEYVGPRVIVPGTYFHSDSELIYIGVIQKYDE